MDFLLYGLRELCKQLPLLLANKSVYHEATLIPYSKAQFTVPQLPPNEAYSVLDTFVHGIRPRNA